MTLARHVRSSLTLRGAASMTVLCAAMIEVSCGLNTPYPSRALYTLHVEGPASPAQPPAHKDVVLRIRRVVALAPFNEQAFVYRTGINSVRTDYYNTFVAPPADLITSELTKWLRASQTFAAIVDSHATLPHQWVLERRIQDLSIDISNPQKVEAVVTIQILLMDDSPAVPRVLLDKSYTERAPVGSADPASGAEAWSAACGKLFSKVADDFKGVAAP